MRRRLFLLRFAVSFGIVLPLLLAADGCDGAQDAAPPIPPAMVQQVPGLTAEQKARADALVSIFENDTPVVQYGYAEDLHDGRGITCGRAGFTTATGDALDVVETYTADAPGNALARFLPVLRRLAERESDAVADLGGFASAWTVEARLPRFDAAQDSVSDRLYYRPAMQTADEVGIATALGRFVLYDAIVQHGEGDDPDGLPALVAQTHAQRLYAANRPFDEAAWIDAFLKVRLRTLRHAHDPGTRAEWAASTDRVKVQQTFLREGRYDLAGPLRVESVSFHHLVP